MLQIYVYVVVKLNVLFITDVILLNENKVIHNIYLSTFELMYINIWQTRNDGLINLNEDSVEFYRHLFAKVLLRNHHANL